MPESWFQPQSRIQSLIYFTRGGSSSNATGMRKSRPIFTLFVPPVKLRKKVGKICEWILRARPMFKLLVYFRRICLPANKCVHLQIVFFHFYILCCWNVLVSTCVRSLGVTSEQDASILQPLYYNDKLCIHNIACSLTNSKSDADVNVESVRYH